MNSRPINYSHKFRDTLFMQYLKILQQWSSEWKNGQNNSIGPVWTWEHDIYISRWSILMDIILSLSKQWKIFDTERREYSTVINYDTWRKIITLCFLSSISIMEIHISQQLNSDKVPPPHCSIQSCLKN